MFLLSIFCPNLRRSVVEITNSVAALVINRRMGVVVVVSTILMAMRLYVMILVRTGKVKIVVDLRSIEMTVRCVAIMTIAWACMVIARMSSMRSGIMVVTGVILVNLVMLRITVDK